MGELRRPVGTGSHLPSSWRETYATANIVAYGGRPSFKLGREFLLTRLAETR